MSRTTSASDGGRADEVGAVLGALADDTRRAIIERLADGATPTATELARDLPMTRQAVTKHLRVLEAADLVEGVRRGREARYALRPARLEVATRWLEELGTTWERRLTALKDQAEREAGT